MSLYSLVTHALTRAGEHASPKLIHGLNQVINYLEVGRWLKANGFESKPRYNTRANLYRAIAEEVKNEHVLYLEFGVWKGASLREWSKLLRNPLSSLHGFDSFEGLPEVWNPNKVAGAFSLNGEMPAFDDQRITLHIGWFNDTLPGFDLPSHQRLIINLDADLYSSTIFALRTLRASLAPGSILIFDEFQDRNHELHAFDEFIKETRIPFRFLAATKNLIQTAFIRQA